MREMRNKSKSSMLEACGLAYLRCRKRPRRTEARLRRSDQRTRRQHVSDSRERERVKKLQRSIVKKIESTIRI